MYLRGNAPEQAMDRFATISPLDYRYCASQRIHGKVKNHLTEQAFLRFQAQVEAALVQGFANRELCSQKVADEVRSAVDMITAEEVYQEDEKIHHVLRSLVNCLRRHVSAQARPFIHLGVTSFDVIDTANALRYKEFAWTVLLQELLNLEKTLMDLASREKDTLQIGRTHGQHAVPITFGFFIASYVARLGESILEIQHAANNLRGKLSGAVGAYNATSLLLDDPVAFEKEVLELLGLKPASHSTQIVPGEFIADLVHSVIEAFGVLANLADDLRHLQRSEINEVAEVFDKDQVGSSTMPHKRNPWNFENIKSLYKQFMPRIITVYLDQISEHQRDLTNSASARFIPEIFAGFLSSVLRMNDCLQKLVVDKEALRRNIESSKENFVAEPLYILLAFHGHPDAHEYVRAKTLEAAEQGKPIRELVLEDPDIELYLEKFTVKQRQVLENPLAYTGVAAKKTEEVCSFWKDQLKL